VFYNSRVHKNTKYTPKCSPKHITLPFLTVIPVGIMEITKFNMCVFLRWW